MKEWYSKRSKRKKRIVAQVKEDKEVLKGKKIEISKLPEGEQKKQKNY